MKGKGAGVFFLGVALWGLWASIAPAATRTWLGNADGYWSAATNWVEGTLGANDTPTFGAAGSAGTALTNDTPALTTYAGLAFGNSASAFTIDGAAIVLGGNITVGTGVSTEVIVFPITLSATRTFTVNSGTLTLGGSIGESSQSGLIKAGAGALALNSTNTYTGTTTIYGGGKLTLNAAGGSLSSSSGVSLGANGDFFGAGAFVYDNAGASGATLQTLASLSSWNSVPNDNTVQVTRTAAQPVALAFAAVSANTSENGNVINFVASDVAGGGVNGTDYKIALGNGLSALVGSGTNSYYNIVNQNAYFNGGDFAVYDPAGYVRGIRYGTDTNSATTAGGTSFAATPNQEITGDITAQPSVTLGTGGALGTLKISGACNLTMTAGSTLAFSAGGNVGVHGILKTGGGTSVIGGGAAVNLGNTQGDIRVDGSGDVLEITMPVTFAATTRLMKSGAGTLILSSGNFALTDGRNNLYINGGILDIGGSATITHPYAGNQRFAIARGAMFRHSSSSVSSTDGVGIVGAGSVSVTGGILTLSGANAYTGPTTVMNGGTLVGVTGGSCINSALTVAGGATNGVRVITSGGQWSCSSLTYGAGSNAADFNFGVVPSTATAPLQINGNLDIQGALNVAVRAGVVIPAGTYPLIKYTGALTGIPPVMPLSLPPGMSATLVNNTAQKTIDLNVALGNLTIWGVGSGEWDINTTDNWRDSTGTPIKFQDGQTVQFDDTASGASPIAVALNVAVKPGALLACNSHKEYIISGTGSIAAGIDGSGGALTKNGPGTMTLGVPCSFSGGTTVNGGGALVVSGVTVSNIASALRIGSSDSSNSLTIASGGYVSAVGDQYAIVGSGTKFNVLSVTGGSVLTNAPGNTGALQVGYGNNSDSNTMIIASGGKVYSSGRNGNDGRSGIASYTATARGNKVVITDPGSKWTVGYGVDGFITGGVGTMLVVTNQGTLSTLGISIGWSGTATSDTTILVTGTGSVWNAGTINWNQSANNLIVTNGGQVFAGAVQGRSAGRIAITVTGTNSLLNSSGSLYLGNNSATPTGPHMLTVANGGVAKCSDAQIGWGATCPSNIVVVTDSGSAWSNATLQVGASAGGNLVTIANTGRVDCTSSAKIGNASGVNSNCVRVISNGSFRVNGTLTVGHASSIGNSLAIGGGTVQCEDIAILSGAVNFIDDMTAVFFRKPGLLYVRTANKNAAALGALVTAGAITLNGSATALSSFVITEISSGTYSGYTEVKRLAPPAGGSVLTVR